MEEQTYIIHWQGIDIEAVYVPKASGGAIAHLTLTSVNPERAPLPVTETGYRSHFHPVGTIEAEFNGDVVRCVTEWLNAESKSKDWKRHQESQRQPDLFG